MASINLTFKGLTGVYGSVTGFDDTTTIDDLITAIAAVEGLNSNYYQISKIDDPSNTLSSVFGDSSASVASLGIVNGDTILCTTNQTGTKQVRQVQKLDIAQLKRKGTFRDTGTYTNASDAPYYRANNTYALSALPDTYNGNFPGADDNENAGGLLPFRPWNTATGVAGVDITGLTLATGLVERTYNSDYFGDKTSPYDDQTAYDAFFGGSPSVDNEAVVSSISRVGTVAETTTYTLLGYFRPDATGTWNFRINSDDGSYLFLGSDAEVNDNDAPTNILLANAVVDNGGKHAAQSRSGTFYLESGEYYYLYAIFGNDTGPGTAVFYYTKPGESESTDFTGLIFHNTATNGQ